MAWIKNSGKIILTNLSVILLSLLFIFCFAEISLRAYHYYKYNINIFNDANHGLFTKDDKLGWKISNNLSYDTKEKDALNNIYDLHVETDRNGFRLFGNPESNKIRLFFIGDSFTAAMNVSNDKTYYGFIKDKLKDVEVFAYGVGGYGSLQEYMILDKFIDLIKPNMIILQFFDNDFCRNDIELDILKSFYNTGTPRPYLNLNGEITYQYAKYDNLFIVLPSPIAKNVRLLKILNTRLSFLINSLSKNKTAFDEIPQSGVTNEEFGRSAKITKMIMAMVKRSAGKIPVYLFCITEKQPYYNTIKNICQSVGIHFIVEVPQRLMKYEKETPYSTKAADREHLNEKGNRIVSESLIDYFKKEAIIQQERLP